MRKRPLAWIAAAALAAGPAAAAEQVADGIAAQVGSDIVLVSEVSAMVEPMEQKMRAAGVPEAQITALHAEGLERMIEWRLIEQVVRQSELNASDEEIDSAIASIAKENDLTLDELHRSVTSHGLTLPEYRAQIKREVERRRVVNVMVGSQVHVDEGDVTLLFHQRYADQPSGGETIHLRQILITFGDEGRDRRTAGTLAFEALNRIHGGEPFEVVANDLSELEPEKGGDVGWLHTDRLADWMGPIVSRLEPDQTSNIIELPMAFTILKLVERKPYEPVTFEMVKPDLEREISETLLAQKYAEWMEELRRNIYIERKGYFEEAEDLDRSVFSGSQEDPPLP
jgi:peptidyl-prolyl cis-trans isomerase SurA